MIKLEKQILGMEDRKAKLEKFIYESSIKISKSDDEKLNDNLRGGKVLNKIHILKKFYFLILFDMNLDRD